MSSSAAVSEQDVSPSQTLVSVFDQQARRHRARAAVADGSRTLTYADLSARSDRLARRLRAAAAVERGSIVGVAVDRSAELIVAMLAVLKAGAAYLPLDTDYPAERLRFMIEDANAAAVLADAAGADRLRVATSAPIVRVDGDEDTPLLVGELPEPRPEDPAYVIYTSGTTGRPKGVVVEHRNVIGLFDAARQFDFDHHDVWCFFHSFAFDFSVWEIWGALLHGGRLEIVPFSVARDPELFAKLIRERDVTVLNQTPSAFRGLVRVAQPLPSLRVVVFGGEPIDLQSASEWFDTQGESAELVNMYGITETTVHVTYLRLTKQLCAEWKSPGTPIGKPLSGAWIQLTDQRGQPTEAGEVGEICVGGWGVARGYLFRPELTAQRFVRDESGSRLYRSGDLGRMLPNGEVVHLGRQDEQVKVRGFRIELPEVESVLDRLEGVEKSAATVAGEGVEATLVAYVVPHRETAPVICRLLAARDANPMLELTEMPNGVEIAHANPGETRFLYDEVYLRQAYARNGIAVPDGACVFDLGANIGVFSLWAIEQAADVSVFAFEPLPPTFRLLEANIRLHQLPVKAFPFGIGVRDEEVSFFFFPHDTIFSGRYASTSEREIVGELLRRESGDVSAQTLAELLDDRMRTETYRCRVRPLSDVMADLRIDRIDLLKIDVEKGERDVLDGIAPRDWPKIAQIVIEAHDVGVAEALVRELERQQYTVTAEEDEGLRGVGLVNVFARRGSRLASERRATLPRYRGRLSMARELQQRLEEILPPHAVPSLIELVAELPLTANGKIDRAAVGKATGEQPAAPRPAALTADERVVAAVFEEVLGRPVNSADDNFFKLGGQSLVAIEAVLRLRRRFGCEFPLGLIFRHPSVAALAAAIVSHAATWPPPEDAPPAVASQSVRGAAEDVPSETEMPLWAFQELFPDSDALNVAREVVVDRPYEDEFRRLIGVRLSRHRSLRACFVEDGGDIRKAARDVCLVPTRTDDMTDEEFEEFATREIRRPFELGIQVPIRIFVGPRSSEKTRLLVVMHHIATDGVSMTRLIREIVETLSVRQLPAEDGVEAADVSDPRVRLADARADGYWRELLSGLEPLPLPQGRLRKPWPSITADSIECDVRIPSVAGAEGSSRATPQTVCLAAFGAALQSLLATPDVTIAIPYSNRDRPAGDALGCFVAMAPIRIRSADGDALRSTQEQLLRLIENGSPSATATRSAPIPRIPVGHPPLCQAAFSYHEEPIDRIVSLGDLTASVRERRPSELQFDVFLIVVPVDERTSRARLEYRCSSFTRDEAAELLHAFVRALEDVEAAGPVR